MQAGLTVGAWIAAGVLGWAGCAKVWRPAGTSAALRLAGLPSSTVIARGLGVAEVALATAVLGFGGWSTHAALACAYCALTVFAHRQRRRPEASCGCFGDDDAPLTTLHVTIDGSAAGVALAAAVIGAPGLPSAVGATPAVLVPSVLLLGVATWLMTQLLTTVPTLATALMRSHPRPAEAGAPVVNAQAVRAQGARS